MPAALPVRLPQAAEAEKNERGGLPESLCKIFADASFLRLYEGMGRHRTRLCKGDGKAA